MRLLLSELLPLRATKALGAFAEDAALPHRYGNLTSGRFKLIRLDDSTFFVADHPMTVTAVFVDEQESKGWEQQTKADTIGHTWTVVRLAAPAAADARLSACGTGKRNPRTGTLIENPADICEDIMRLAGRTDAWWDQLRAEAAEEGLRLAGSIDTALSIRAVLDAVLGSAGAIWCPGMARLYPVSTVSGYIAPLDAQKALNIVVTADLDNTADIFRLSYDPDAAGDKSQHYVELTANPSLYGGVVREEVLSWLRTPGNAETVGRRMLQWFAGERYDVTFDCGDRSIRSGQWVRLLAHPEWPIPGADPYVMVLTAEVTPGSKTVKCTGKALLSLPIVTVTAHSIALPTTREAGVEISIKGGVATLIVFDKDHIPIPGASVGLDGGAAKKTNAEGAVLFQIKVAKPPKEHRLAIQAPGKVATVQTIMA